MPSGQRPPELAAARGDVAELTFTGTNVVLIYFPLADGWVHEEYHRAALTTGGVASYDTINSFRQFGAGTISVTRVRDEDLARFKRADPAGFSRSLVAGGEGELLLTRNLLLSNFFDDTHLPLVLYGALIKSSVADYPNSDANLADTEGAADLRARELRETAIADRDFTGPDYAGWAWHLFKPDVPYAALGTHPTGVGLQGDPADGGERPRVGGTALGPEDPHAGWALVPGGANSGVRAGGDVAQLESLAKKAVEDTGVRADGPILPSTPGFVTRPDNCVILCLHPLYDRDPAKSTAQWALCGFTWQNLPAYLLLALSAT